MLRINRNTRRNTIAAPMIILSVGDVFCFHLSGQCRGNSPRTEAAVEESKRPSSSLGVASTAELSLSQGAPRRGGWDGEPGAGGSCDCGVMLGRFSLGSFGGLVWWVEEVALAANAWRHDFMFARDGTIWWHDSGRRLSNWGLDHIVS